MIDADCVVGRRPRHKGRIDVELLPENSRTSPGGNRIVCTKNDNSESIADVVVCENCFDAVGAEQAVAVFEYDDIGFKLVTMPKSEKIMESDAPASSIARMSRRNETPVALQAATLRPR